MNYLEKLKDSAVKFNSIVCLGLDPEIEEIPLEGKPSDIIFTFYESILNKILQKRIYPSAVKPNYAFYAQYGIAGIEVLCKIIEIYKREGFPVILDFKRGDIGKTAAAYAREAFEFFGADAVTLSPYMGYDSIAPFTEKYPDKGCYILTKTSNKSSTDLQDLMVEGRPLYLHTAERIVQWHSPGMGSVVGATYPSELVLVQDIFTKSGKEIPLLIPGIGSQGGDVQAVVQILKKSGNYNIHRINSSSAINYAYKKKHGVKFDEAAVQALDELNTTIG